MTKMKLIDADEILKEKYLESPHYCDYVVSVEEIENAPTIEAEPVRHGEWKICCDGYYPYCSVCKEEPIGRKMSKYCPNCGAKMDLEESE